MTKTYRLVDWMRSYLSNHKDLEFTAHELLSEVPADKLPGQKLQDVRNTLNHLMRMGEVVVVHDEGAYYAINL